VFANFRIVAALALLAYVTIAGVLSAHARGEFMGDFRAFYCAGELARAHAFTYDPAALTACESRPESGFFTATETSVPAPLPGYAIAPFALLSFLPFPVASALWFTAVLACGIAGVWLLSKLGLVPFDLGIALASILLGAVNAPVGELPPLAFLGMALVMHGCKHDDRRARIVGLLLTFAEPQIALGVAVALAATATDWRRYAEIAGTLALLGALTVATVGFDQTLAYAITVVPAHVASEVQRVQQYTLSWVLAQLNVAPAGALWIGRAAYLGSLFYTYGVARRPGTDPARAVAAGGALALFFGPFVHLDHILCALPAALLVADALPVTGAIGLLLLAIPLTVVFGNPLLIVAVPIVTYWATAQAYAALGATVAALGIAGISARIGFTFRSAAATSGTWAQYIARHDIVSGLLIWIVKAPVWIGLGISAIGVVRLLGATTKEDIGR